MSPRSHSTAGRRMCTRLTRGEQPAMRSSRSKDLSLHEHLRPHDVPQTARATSRCTRSCA
eukprot:6382912-Prymnesium_polylepis.1